RWSDADRVAARPRRTLGVAFGSRLPVLVAVLLASLLAVTVTTNPLRPSMPAERSAPAAPPTTVVNDARERAVPGRPRRDAARGRRPRTRKRSKPHRPARPQRTGRDQQSIRPALSRPPTPRPPPRSAPRGLQRAEPARPHPAPVPATAPPEFL
ncbi:MAG: hypothetical protein LC790_06015, partial [Actinobacteria bacterium]|nr:hypothetical protein [Actinomycetota bacterium]